MDKADKATTEEAIAGTNDTHYMTPKTVKEAIPTPDSIYQDGIKVGDILLSSRKDVDSDKFHECNGVPYYSDELQDFFNSYNWNIYDQSSISYQINDFFPSNYNFNNTRFYQVNGFIYGDKRQYIIACYNGSIFYFYTVSNIEFKNRSNPIQFSYAGNVTYSFSSIELSIIDDTVFALFRASNGNIYVCSAPFPIGNSTKFSEPRIISASSDLGYVKCGVVKNGEYYVIYGVTYQDYGGKTLTAYYSKDKTFSALATTVVTILSPLLPESSSYYNKAEDYSDLGIINLDNGTQMFVCGNGIRYRTSTSSSATYTHVSRLAFSIISDVTKIASVIIAKNGYGDDADFDVFDPLPSYTDGKSFYACCKISSSYAAVYKLNHDGSYKELVSNLYRTDIINILGHDDIGTYVYIFRTPDVSNGSLSLDSGTYVIPNGITINSVGDINNHAVKMQNNLISTSGAINKTIFAILPNSFIYKNNVNGVNGIYFNIAWHTYPNIGSPETDIYFKYYVKIKN